MDYTNFNDVGSLRDVLSLIWDLMVFLFFKGVCSIGC